MLQQMLRRPLPCGELPSGRRLPFVWVTTDIEMDYSVVPHWEHNSDKRLHLQGDKLSGLQRMVRWPNAPRGHHLGRRLRPVWVTTDVEAAPARKAP